MCAAGLTVLNILVASLSRTRHPPPVTKPIPGPGLPTKPDGGRQANNPLHGVTLEMMVKRLVEHFGWEELGQQIIVRCFNVDPSLKSSLAFLRKTPWARAKVEKLYLATFHP